MNHYESLGVPKNADAATIKQAYRRMSKKHHPDRGGDVRAMVAVNKAYECLSDPDKRSYYDATGAEKPLTSSEQVARATLIQMAIQVACNTESTEFNLVVATRRKLEESIGTVKKNIANMKAAEVRLKKHADRLVCDEPENDMQRAFFDQIQAMKLQIQNANGGLEAITAALALLKKYRSTFIEPAADSFESRYNQAVNWMGGGGARRY